MIDTHAHLYLEAYNQDRDNVFQTSLRKLDYIINIGINKETSRAAIDLTRESDQFYATIGYHPDESLKANHDKENVAQELENLLTENYEVQHKIVAIGEIGLDYNKEPVDIHKNLQTELFAEQIDFAMQKQLPIVVHSRDAFQDTYDVLVAAKKSGPISGVWHSFTGTPEQADMITQLGLVLGINGIVTFNSAKELQQAVTSTSLDSIILETDSPYLAPQPVRGQRNLPEHVSYTAEKIAKLKGITAKEVEQDTTKSACSVFKLPTV